MAKGQGAPGVRRGRKGPENTATRSKARVSPGWAPIALDAAEDVKHEANVRTVAEALAECRTKSAAGKKILGSQLLLLLNQRDYYLELIGKRSLTGDEGKAANANHGSVFKILASLGLDELRDVGACKVCNGDTEINGKPCKTCDGSGEEPL